MSEYLDIPALYGSSVFSEKEMRASLPREIYTRLSAKSLIPPWRTRWRAP